MSNYGPNKSPATQPDACSTPPIANSEAAHPLIVGRGVSVHFNLQSAIVWEPARHERAKIVIALDPVEAVMFWQDSGRDVRHASSDPHVWVVPAGTTHQVEWRGTSGLVVLYVEPYFVREVCAAEIRDSRVSDLRILARVDLLLWKLTEKFREFCHGRQRDSPALVEAIGTLLAAQILKAYLTGEVSQTKSRAGLSTERLRLATDYIEAHLRDKLSQRMLARAVNLSEYHFARMFRISTRFSPQEYVMRRRVLRARELLLGGGLKVAAVAADVGFCDQSHLNRHFMRVLGCSPGSIIPGIEHDDP